MEQHVQYNEKDEEKNHDMRRAAAFLIKCVSLPVSVEVAATQTSKLINETPCQ